MSRHVLHGSRVAFYSTLVLCAWALLPSPALAQTGGQQGEVLLEAAVSSPSTGALKRPGFEDAARANERHRMAELQIEHRNVSDPAVLQAMRKVPRHEFVPVRLYKRAYGDNPLPIGHGQTISQPYIVAYMTEQLDLAPGDRVLEIGTGSGYQAAVLAMIAREVVTIEIIGALAESAAVRLERLGFNNITAIHGDGYFGWPPRAPYDAIIVTAAAEHVPPPLVRQLKPGARMAIPVGQSGWTQNLLLVEKRSDGTIRTRNLMPVRFVPFTRKQR